MNVRLRTCSQTAASAMHSTKIHRTIQCQHCDHLVRNMLKRCERRRTPRHTKYRSRNESQDMIREITITAPLVLELKSCGSYDVTGKNTTFARLDLHKFKTPMPTCPTVKPKARRKPNEVRKSGGGGLQIRSHPKILRHFYESLHGLTSYGILSAAPVEQHV